MIPNHVLSFEPVINDYLHPDSKTALNLTDRESGGVALDDPTHGLNIQTWVLSYITPDVVITPEVGESIVLFSLANITQLSLAFDQNMHPFVTYVLSGDAWYWWFDPLIPAQTHVQMATDVLTPRCCIDDKRDKQTSASDIILAYIKDGIGLFYREQSDRYGIEYLLHADVNIGSLNKVGMHKSNRLQFFIAERDPTTWDPIADPEPPPPEVELTPLEILKIAKVLGTLDVTLLDSTTFIATFGIPVDGVDFDRAIRTGKIMPVLTTLDDARIHIINSPVAKEVLALLMYADPPLTGDIIASLHTLDPQMDPNDFFALTKDAPTLLAIASDSGNARIRKYNGTPIPDPDPDPDPDDPDPPIDPPINPLPVDPSAILFENFFSLGLPIPHPTFPDFLLLGGGTAEGEGWTPPQGIAIPLVIPFTTATLTASMLVIPNTTTEGLSTIAISTTPFNFNTSWKADFGLGGNVGGIFNPLTPISVAPSEFIFKEFKAGQVYYFNIRYKNGGGGYFVIQADGRRTGAPNLIGTIAFENFFKIARLNNTTGTQFVAPNSIGVFTDTGEGWFSPGGMSIAFTIPSTNNRIIISMQVIGQNTTIGVVLGTISTTPLDFNSSPQQNWGFDGVIGGVINPEPADLVNPQFTEFVQGQTYYFNFRYESITFQAFGPGDRFITIYVTRNRIA